MTTRNKYLYIDDMDKINLRADKFNDGMSGSEMPLGLVWSLINCMYTCKCVQYTREYILDEFRMKKKN